MRNFRKLVLAFDVRQELRVADCRPRFGPSVAGLLVTGLVDGRAGLRELLSRLLRWRVGARWYAVALLTAPLVYVAMSFALSLTSRAFLPGILTTSDTAALLLLGLAYGLLGGGFCEELGWTGFAVPRLRQRYGVLTTGLIVGVLWGAYHFSVIYWSSSPSGALPLAHLARAALRVAAGLPGADGVGLRPDREPARGDAHAREFSPAGMHHPHADGASRGALADLARRLGRRAVGRRCSGRRGQRRAALATAAPDAGGVTDAAEPWALG